MSQKRRKFVAEELNIEMAKEIERKFLVAGDSYREAATRVRHIVQGYLNTDPDRTVRVRVVDSEAYVTVKSRNCGATRDEWEFAVAVDDARQMLGICTGVIEKTRFCVPSEDGLLWEVDEFGGRHAGLVVAEIELPAEDAPFSLPGFAGEEVTGDARYYNSNLAAQA